MSGRIKEKKPRADGVVLALALYFIGGELLTVGIADTEKMYSALFAYVILCFLSIAAASAAGEIFSVGHVADAKGVLLKISLLIFGGAVIASAVCVILTGIGELADFVGGVMLLETPKWIVATTFLGFCIFLATRGIACVKKFAIISFFAVGIATVLLFLLSLPLLDLENLSLSAPILPDIDLSIRIFAERFAPFGVAIAYFGCEWTKMKEGNRRALPRASISGVLIGAVILLVCYLNVALLLGTEFARGEKYPYSLAVSAISAGKLFMRMEALSYATYFLSLSLRTSISVGAIWEIVKKFKPRTQGIALLTNRKL